MVRVRDIVTIDASSNYMTIKVAGEDEPVTVRGSLRKCLQKLPVEFFFRTGRDCAVNLLQIARVNVTRSNILLIMKDGREIVMSRIQSRIFGRQRAL